MTTSSVNKLLLCGGRLQSRAVRMYKLLVICASPLLLLAGLSGCGGGNSSSGGTTIKLSCAGLSGTALLDCKLQGGSLIVRAATPSTAQFPLQVAMSAYFQAAHNFTINATNGANTYSLQINSTPGDTSTFGEQAASTTSTTEILSENGALINTVYLMGYFQSPYTPLGEQNLSNGQYTVAANQVALPANATVGQSGQFDTSTTYTSDTMSTVYSTTTTTWSLAASTATTAWLCFNYAELIVGSGAISEADCYNIDTTGDVSTIKANVSVNGTTLNFVSPTSLRIGEQSK